MSLEELGRFLRARRNTLPPPAASHDTHRRVPGQRREEVADAAAISTDYYTKLEQGRAAKPSDQVVTSLGRVMEWTEPERHYVDLLLRPPTRRPREPDIASSVMAELVSQQAAGPALLVDRSLAVVATNPLANEVFFDPYDIQAKNLNMARWIFCTQAARDVFVFWRPRANSVVGMLRMSLAENPDNADVQSIIANLGRYPAFARLWRRHAAIGSDSFNERVTARSRQVQTYQYITLQPSSASWPRALFWLPLP